MIPAEAFYAGLFKVAAAAAGFITDSSGRVLLVKPGYRDHWGWPGGHVDEGESPEVACGRELAEELGLTRPVGRLLVVHWVPPLDDRPIPLVHFLFDCGTFEDGTAVVLQEEELDDYGFFTPEQAASLMPAYLLARLTAAGRARETGATVYLGAATSGAATSGAATSGAATSVPPSPNSFPSAWNGVGERTETNASDEPDGEGWT